MVPPEGNKNSLPTLLKLIDKQLIIIIHIDSYLPARLFSLLITCVFFLLIALSKRTKQSNLELETSEKEKKK